MSDAFLQLKCPFMQLLTTMAQFSQTAVQTHESFVRIPIINTNYRKGDFSALFGTKHFCGEEIAACGSVFARQTTVIVWHTVNVV